MGTTGVTPPKSAPAPKSAAQKGRDLLCSRKRPTATEKDDEEHAKSKPKLGNKVKEEPENTTTSGDNVPVSPSPETLAASAIPMLTERPVTVSELDTGRRTHTKASWGAGCFGRTGGLTQAGFHERQRERLGIRGTTKPQKVTETPCCAKKKPQFNSNPLNLNQNDTNSISTTHRLRLNPLKSSRRPILKFLGFPPGHLPPVVKWSMIRARAPAGTTECTSDSTSGASDTKWLPRNLSGECEKNQGQLLPLQAVQMLLPWRRLPAAPLRQGVCLGPGMSRGFLTKPHNLTIVYFDFSFTYPHNLVLSIIFLFSLSMETTMADDHSLRPGFF